jgi:WD40 repeat protein
VATGKESKVVRYGDGEPRGFRFGGEMSPTSILSGDTKVLAVVSQRGPSASVTIIETETGKERKRFPSNELFKNGGNFFEIDIDLNDDGKWLLVAGGNQRGPQHPIFWLDTTSGQRLHEIAPEKDCSFGRAQFSRDGRQVVAVEYSNNKANGRLRIFDAVRGNEIRSVELPANTQFQYFELRPDGKTLLASTGQGGGPGMVRLFDFSPGKELKELRSFTDAARRGSFVQTRDGEQLFVVGNGKVVQMDIESGKELRQFGTPNLGKVNQDFFPGPAMNGNSLAVSADGKQLAISGRQSFAVYDIATGKQKAGGSGGAAVGVVHFTPDGAGLVVANTDQVVELWDVKRIKLLKTLDRPDNAGPPRPGFGFFTTMFQGGAAFSCDGKFLAVGLQQGGVGVWDAATGKFLKSYGADEGNDKNGPEIMPTSFAFAPNSHVLAVGLPNGTIKLWDVATGQPLRSWGWHTTGRGQSGPEAAMLSMTFSPDGKTLAGGGIVNVNDGVPRAMVILWETATGKERLRLQTVAQGPGNGDPSMEMIFGFLDQMAVSIQFSPDGKTLAIGSFSGLHLVDALTGKDIASYSGRMMMGWTVVFSPDGKLLFFGRADGSVRVLEAATGRLVQDFPGHTESIISLALSPDGKTLVSGSNDSTVLLWDMAELSKPAASVKPGQAGKDLNKLWEELANDDAAKAYQAMNALATVPVEAVPMLKGHLKAIPPVDPKLLAKLMDDLNSDKFAVREKANAELEKLGDLAGPILKERLAAQPPLEMRQRMEKLMGKLNGPVQSPQTLQALRAIEVLERIGNREALALLADLAKGAPGHRVTEDARDSVQRLERQVKKS